MQRIELDSVHKRFGDTQVLRGVSLEIDEGEFVSLVGPSGCGKSTLLRIVAGLETQDEGSIRINGAVVDEVRPCDRDLAMVFQSYALYPHLSVRENIAVPLRMRELRALQRLPILGRLLPGTRQSLGDIEVRVAQAAEQLEILHLLDRKPVQLSGGQRQRVAVGRALVRNPTGFLLDEPLSNLDAKLRVHMRGEIVRLHRRLGKAFVYVTHDQAEAMTMSDRIAVMHEGEIMQMAAPSEVYNDPANLAVAEFIGSPKINVLDASVEAGGLVRVGETRLPIATDAISGPIRIGVRPEALRVGLLAQSCADPTLCGTATLIEDLGSEAFVHVRLDDGAECVGRADAARFRGRMTGGRVELAIDPARVLLFDGSGQRIRARSVRELVHA
ncbi:MAG: ABC transporter ATP-binding protein [Burkholderiaceae bacterium]